MAKRKQRMLALHQAQYDFVNASEFITALLGGRGVGKTFSGAVKVLTQARGGEDWMSVSPDNGVILDTTFPTFMEVARNYRKLVRAVRSPYPRIWFKTQDGGEANIIMRSGEVPEKLRGPNKAGLWLDEASIMVRDVFDIGIATLRAKGGANQVFLTMTPRGKYHWTFDLFYELLDEYQELVSDPERIKMFGGQYYLQKPDTYMVQAASYMNPFLPPGYSDKLRQQYSDEFAEQEIEGNFVDIAGLLFTRDNFRIIGAMDVPRGGQRIRYWDQASTPGKGDYSVGLLMLRDTSGRFIVESVVRGQWSPKDRRDIMLRTAELDREKYHNEVVIYVEQEPGSGGKEQMDQNVVWLAGFPVYRDQVARSGKKNVRGVPLPNEAKVTRAMPFAAMVENENVFLVRAGWNESFIGEMCSFPESTHDDQVDCAAGAFNKLATRVSSGVSAELRKVDKLQSHAARVLQLASDLRLSRSGSLGKTESFPERIERQLDNSRNGGGPQ